MSAKLEIVSEYSGGPSKTKSPSRAALDSQQKHPNQASFAQIDPKLSTIIEADIDPHNLDKRSQDDLVWEPAKATKRDDQLLQKKSASFFQPLPQGDHPKPETSSPSVAQGKTQLSSSSVTSKLTRIPSLLPASQTNIYNMKTQKISLLPIQVQKVNRDKYLSFDDKATRWNVSCSLLGLLGLVCQVLENFHWYERVVLRRPADGLEYKDIDRSMSDGSFTLLMRTISLVSTVGAIGTLIMAYKMEVLALIQRGEVPPNSTMKSLGWVRSLVLEALYLSICAPPVQLGVLTLEYKSVSYYIGWNQLITAIMLGRAYLILKILTSTSRYRQPTCMKACEQFYVIPTKGFALRAMLIDQPYFIALLSYASTVLVCSIGLKIFEVPYPTGSAYDSMANPAWNMIITMSTVGYGDLFPQTLYGRIFSVLGMFAGQFCNTLILLAMKYISELSMQHTRAFQSYKKTEFLISRAKTASELMGKLAYTYLIKKEYPIKRFEKEGPFKALTRLQTSLRLLAHKQRLDWAGFLSNEANGVDIHMLVAQFNEKLVVETQKTEEMFGDKVNQVTNLVTELQSLCARLDEKAVKLSASSKLTISNLDLYRRNFVSKVPTYKLKIENMWGEAIREGNAAGDKVTGSFQPRELSRLDRDPMYTQICNSRKRTDEFTGLCVMGIIKQNKYQQDRIKLLKQQELQKEETLSPEILLQRAKEEELKRYAKLMKGYTVDELVQESLLQPLGGLGNKEKNKNRFLHSNFYTEKNVKPLDPFLRIPRNKVLPVIFTDQRTAIQLYHESTSDRKDVREAKRTKIKDNAFVKNENFNSSKYSKARQEQRAARTKKQEDLTKLPKGENDGTESPAKAAKGEQKLTAEDLKGPNNQIAALNIDQLAEQIESPQNSRSPGRKLTQLKPEVYKIVDTTSTRVALTQLQELRQKKERKMLYLDGEPPNEEGGAFQPTGTDEKQTPSGNKGLVSPEMRAAQARKKYLEVDPTSMLPTQFLKEKDSWIKGHKFGLPATDFPQ